MPSTRLFGNRIPPACKYCEGVRGLLSADGAVLCEKKGVVAADYHCRHYRYDPLKREPRKRTELPRYKAEDFSID